MTTSERLADALFTELDDGRWEYTVLPLMKTRILTEEEKEDRNRFLRVSTKLALCWYLGFLLMTALLPWVIWLAVATDFLFEGKIHSLYFAFVAIAPLIALFVVGMWRMPRAQRRLKYRKVLMTAPRGRRVKWASYWRAVGSALGPLPIQVVLALTAFCLFGTIVLSASIGDVYLSQIVNMVLTCILLGPAIPAGLRSKPNEASELTG